MKTLIIDELSVDFYDLLKARGLEKYFLNSGDKTEDSEIVIIKTFTTVDEAFLHRYPRLKLIIRAGSGCDNIDLKQTESRNIIVCNTPEANAISAFEHTVSLILALLKQLQTGKANLERKKWKEGHSLNSELSNLKALVIGVGRIGSRVARFLQSFGAEVYGVDPYLTPEQWKERGVTAIDYEEGVRWCNLITYHCPLTDETVDYFSGESLRKLTHPVWIINTARGGIVNEEALLQGLKSGMILGAGLDVYCNEPDPQLPFKDFENVYLTPHTGAYTAAGRRRMAIELLEVWESYVFQNRIINEVRSQGITRG